MPREQEVDGSDWGLLLYQDNNKMDNNRLGRLAYYTLAVVMAIITACTILFPSEMDNGRIFLIFNFLSITILVVCIILAMPKSTPFQIFENGIHFTGRGDELIYFKNIHHISIVEYGDLRIFTNADWSYIIANCNEIMNRYTECPHNFIRVSQLVIERMRACNRHRNQNYIVRDLFYLKWTHEAKEKFDARWDGKNDRLERWSEVADGVCAAGRNRVELSDVNRYLEKISRRTF